MHCYSLAQKCREMRPGSLVVGTVSSKVISVLAWTLLFIPGRAASATTLIDDTTRNASTTPSSVFASFGVYGGSAAASKSTATPRSYSAGTAAFGLGWRSDEHWSLGVEWQTDDFEAFQAPEAATGSLTAREGYRLIGHAVGLQAGYDWQRLHLFGGIGLGKLHASGRGGPAAEVTTLSPKLGVGVILFDDLALQVLASGAWQAIYMQDAGLAKTSGLPLRLASGQFGLTFRYYPGNFFRGCSRRQIWYTPEPRFASQAWLADSLYNLLR